MKRGKSKFHSLKRKLRWYDKPPKGTPEELQKAFDIANSYMYKILDYAEKDEVIPKEELEEARRIFAFTKQGPKAAYFALGGNLKLTSADVLYFLTTTQPVSKLAKTYGIEENELHKIRRGENQVWDWEFRFVKRIKGMVKGRMIQQDTRRRIYSISRVYSPTNKLILAYTTSERKAKELRKSFIQSHSLVKMEREKTIDIIYPIELIEIL